MKKPYCIPLEVMMTTLLSMKYVHLISKYWVGEENISLSDNVQMILPRSQED